MKRGGPLRRGVGLARGGSLRRTRLAARSQATVAADVVLAASKVVVAARSGGWCEARIEGVCTGRASACHHVKPRSKGVDHSPGNLLHCCNACHAIGIHGDPIRARERGHLI